MKRNGVPRKRTHWFDLMYGGRVMVIDDEDRWHAVAQLREGAQRLEVARIELHAHPGHALDAAAWRSFPISRLDSEINLPHHARLIREHWGATKDVPVEGAKPRPLRVKGYVPPPTGARRYPDSHYQRVADLYTLFVEHGIPPAKRIAEDWGVEVSKVNRWTKEARRRGLLAPARSRGRAG